MAKRGKDEKPKRNPVLGYRRGNWESYGHTVDVNKFFRGYSGFKSFEAFYKRVAEDDKMLVYQKGWKWRPYWMMRSPDEYQVSTRTVDKEIRYDED